MSSNRPNSPPRGIDHLVIATRDLDRLVDSYRGLGFQVGPRNTHPWGTANHIVQFNGAFLELIGVADGRLIQDQQPRQFSFGAFVRDYLLEGEGLAMLALESRNAVADARAFRLARMGDAEPFFFERQGLAPDGQPLRVSFTLAFALAPAHVRAGFFTCQQHQPQNFWNAERQKHPNGTGGIASVVLVAGDPSDEHEFLGAFINQRAMRATSFGIELDTGRGLVEVLSPEAFTYRFGEAAPVLAGRGTQFAAIEFVGGASSQPAGGRQVGDRCVVPASAAGGVVLSFGR
jgi:catechol 2,3-dioxygenase-like lactoylglutathione lyase family enzyme